ncbi:MAG: ATP-binding cassette domain-containing protein, partial [Alcaligenaceae bacterium]|nr:ATP-binding cassette domain-containing protein [Alcaligenaceae bacterium]
RRAIQNVMLPLEVLGIEYKIAVKRVRAAMEKVGLAGKEDQYPIEMSGGEQQRLAIARAIVNKPAIVIADEPTANLDAVSAKRIMDVFKDFNRVGVTTLIASHDRALMAHYARRTLLIEPDRFSDLMGTPL